MLIVMKFGGTSVGNADRIKAAAELAVLSQKAGHQVVVVTSAMSGVTNKLIAGAENAVKGSWEPGLSTDILNQHLTAARAIVPVADSQLKQAEADLTRNTERFETLCKGISLVHELSPRTLDAISGIGEMLCAPLLASAISACGVPSESIEATRLIVTNDHFGQAEPLTDQTRELSRSILLPLVKKGVIPVITGFIGATVDGVTTTLGRGGSDFSASIIGAALDADEVWIWTDVNGVMSANPSEVPEARTLREISYTEAAELAYYGAKVLHYKTILPACKQGIPVRILNTFQPDDPGTRVSADGRPSSRGVKAVTSIRNVSLISISGKGMQGIPGIAARTFDAVAAVKANVLMIMQASSENNICFVINTSDTTSVVRALREALNLDLLQGNIEDISADDSIAIVAAVGDRMKGTSGISARVFGALGAENINVIAISQGSSEVNISLIVAEKEAARAVQAIHKAFELDLPATA